MIISKPVVSIDQIMGFVLSHERTRQGMSIEDVANQAQIKEYRLKQIEAGRGQLCVWELIRISDALGTQTQRLVKSTRSLASKIENHASAESVTIENRPLSRIAPEQKVMRLAVDRWVAQIAMEK